MLPTAGPSCSIPYVAHHVARVDDRNFVLVHTRDFESTEVFEVLKAAREREWDVVACVSSA